MAGSFLSQMNKKTSDNNGQSRHRQRRVICSGKDFMMNTEPEE